MSKHNIVVALVCVVFFTCARGAIAARLSDEEQIASIPIEWYAPEGYLPEWYKPGDYIPYFSPNDEYLPYDSAEGFPGQSHLENETDGGVGVPEPGTLVLLTSGALGLLAWAWRKRRPR